ncbi:MAG: N-acetyltransferase, partial [Chloroflexi bacterium]|nr:N-acetyltransferase [Chloroflexota bacterium]
DRYPRSVDERGDLLDAGDWELTPTVVKRGARIGANATIVCGVTIGEDAMVGAGSVVTRDVPPTVLVRGNPARVAGPAPR